MAMYVTCIDYLILQYRTLAILLNYGEYKYNNYIVNKSIFIYLLWNNLRQKHQYNSNLHRKRLARI